MKIRNCNTNIYRNKFKVTKNLTRPKQYYPKQNTIIENKLKELEKTIKEQDIKK